ncbi:DEAD/DEAH box helicase [Arthrobacter sp. ov118]|uniref:DEAD/DEAH box helicase n=1 Tax=Arthrobacter sp. ov118 TaxID=1761747 RepID=UPI0015A68C73|nr:DEAD/DEAH box helicase [Arthrobacter sp. ov118]
MTQSKVVSRVATDWAGNPELRESLEREQGETINSYAAKPKLLLEHFNEEDGYRAGSYGQRLIPELIQNSADAMSGPSAGRLQLLLTDNYLYCANDGEPLTNDGMIAILNSHMSGKSNEDLGRFGLGFKSVLAVTSKPEVISRSVSFSFDREISRQRLTAAGVNDASIPLLRLGWLLDPIRAFENDPDLAQLADWASTIIRLPLEAGPELAEKGIAALEPNILLFMPMVRTLTVTRRTALEQSEQVLAVAAGADGWATISRNDHQHSRWRVHSKVMYPSTEALATVPKAIARPKILLSYAAPEETTSRGHFSAVFPLKDQTTARGILSAPWHISDDRTGLLVSRFNDEIIATFAELILETVSHLGTSEDPGRSLEYLPVEPADTTFHYDRELSRHIRRIAKDYVCVPDCSGNYRKPGSVRLPNLDLKLTEDHVKTWASSTYTPDSCAHWTCYRNDTRRSRLRGLVRGFGAKQANERRLAEWLEQMVRRTDLQSCLSALLLLTTFSDDKLASQGTKVLAVPTSGGRLARADATDTVFIASEIPRALMGTGRVDANFLRLPGAPEALQLLGFEQLTIERQFRLLLEKNKRPWTHEDWSAFWQTASQLSKEESIAAIVEYWKRQPDLRVHAGDGLWRSPKVLLSPGFVTPRNPSITVGPAFAAEWHSLLSLLGVTGSPTLTSVTHLANDSVFHEYKQFADQEFTKKYASHSSFLEFNQDAGLGPLWPLTAFRRDEDWESLAQWTLSLLQIAAKKEWTYSNFFARTETGSEKIVVQAPHLWAVDRYGSARTTWGERPLNTSVATSLMRFGKVLPVVTELAVSTSSMPSDLSTVTQDLFREGLSRLTSETDPWVLGEFLAAACRSLGNLLDECNIAASIARRSTNFSAQIVLVVRSQAEAEFVAGIGAPFVACHRTEDYEDLIEQNAFADLRAGLALTVLTEGAGVPETVFDRFGRLRTHPKTRDALRSVSLVQCKAVQYSWQSPAGTLSAATDSALDNDVLFFSEELTDPEILRRLVRATNLDLDERMQEGILRSSLSIEAERRRRRCREADDVPSKLSALVSVGVMEKMLPVGLIALIGQSGPDADLEVPQLFSSVFGESALEELSNELSIVGFEPPYRWSGSTAARRFVIDLGFAVEFAGEPGKAREPRISVPGPTKVEPLHDYQRELVDEVKALVASKGRGMLHLPTGAGKTRTAAQAVVEMMKSQEINSAVLWVAQSDELCEQALQTFESLWRAYGDDRRLDIHRFWGINDLGEDPGGGSRIVIATDAKLARQIGEDYSSWLRRETSMVIVDEAHLAMGKNYRVFLRALGINENECALPLLGLTATPFRGNNVDATFELAAFFGHRKLAMRASDPTKELQSRGILSTVTHEILPGSRVELLGDELSRLKSQGLIPQSVMSRIAQDQNRMRTLLTHIIELPDDWPALVFTPSVQSARILAALLQIRGVSAVALSGESTPAVRRREVEKFRRGETRVLVNCDLFTRGFDAPNVRALYVGRPTFSPNAYLQMVGRGLRGPSNGGSKKCLVVNFTDTFGEFGEDLAFKKLDFLWGSEQPLSATRDHEPPVTRALRSQPERTDAPLHGGATAIPGLLGAGDEPRIDKIVRQPIRSGFDFPIFG